jgi:hypothetical protein
LLETGNLKLFERLPVSQPYAYGGNASRVDCGSAGDFCAHRWRMGAHGDNQIRPDEANEDVLAGALRAAWKLRIEKNQ